MIGVGLGDITGPAADINLVSLMQQLAAASGLVGSLPPLASSPPTTGGPPNFANLFALRHPTWRELSDVKLQFKINFKSLLLQTPMLNNLLRWAMPNQIKMQAEYTYANLVVQL